MTEGVMLHHQMADYYGFLHLSGYERCHEYHGFCEIKKLSKLHHYYIKHYNRLIEEEPLANPDAIPASWYRYTRQNVDTNTKRNAVKNGIEKWISHEEETKDLYRKMFLTLNDLGEIETAKKVLNLVCDVEKEIEWATGKQIDLAASDYSIGYILGEQETLREWYSERMR